MAEGIETCFNYCETGTDKGFFSSNERRWINHIRKLAESNKECVILQEPETNGGFIYAKMPTSWLYIRPPRKVELSDEQRQTLAERLQNSRKQKG